MGCRDCGAAGRACPREQCRCCKALLADCDGGMPRHTEHWQNAIWPCRNCDSTVERQPPKRWLGLERHPVIYLTRLACGYLSTVASSTWLCEQFLREVRPSLTEAQAAHLASWAKKVVARGTWRDDEVALRLMSPRLFPAVFGSVQGDERMEAAVVISATIRAFALANRSRVNLQV